jgi:CRISPR-associated protein Cas1
MVKIDYHLIHEGTLNIDGGTIIIENSVGKNVIPIENVRAIYAHRPVTLSSGIISSISKIGIPIHFFGYYGNYEATLWPKCIDISGDMLIKQVEAHLDEVKRLTIAKQFVSGALLNFNRILSQYDNSDIAKNRIKITNELKNILTVKNIPELMGAEGRAHNSYFSAVDSIIPEAYRINKRERRPPSNMGNSLISFGNSLVYASVLTEIYSTHLNPTISYLHEPSERRFSLALDISEIFKPILSHKLFLYLINKRIIKESDFESGLDKVVLNDKGKKLFLSNYEERLNKHILHRELKRQVSYQELIRFEIYKLEKHLLSIKNYKPFVMWW